MIEITLPQYLTIITVAFVAGCAFTTGMAILLASLKGENHD